MMYIIIPFNIVFFYHDEALMAVKKHYILLKNN